MRGKLSPEIRLQISVTRLKNGIKKIREENNSLKLKLKERDRKITELEAKLVDKESQRKLLSAKTMDGSM